MEKTGFIARLFRGDISLPITYWVFGILIGNFSFNIIGKIIELNHEVITSSKIGIYSLIIFSITTTLYNIFILIAIWRSSGKYSGEAIWAALARISVLLSVLFMIITLFMIFL